MEVKEVPPKEAVVAEGRVRGEDPPKEEEDLLMEMEAKETPIMEAVVGRGEGLLTEDLRMTVEKGTTMGCPDTMMV